jgi:hypothetical protein
MFKKILRNTIYVIFFLPFGYIFIHYIFIGSGFEIGGRQERIDCHSEEIINGITIGRSFISRRNNLSRIDILFNSLSMINNCRITFHLMEIKSLYDGGEDIITLRKAIYNISNNAFVRFEFPPIRDSKDKIYYFYIESNARRQGEGVSVWLSNRRYNEGTLIINGIPTEGDMVYRIYYRKNKIELLATLITDITKNKTAIFNIYINILIFLGYFILLFTLFMILFKKIFFGED